MWALSMLAKPRSTKLDVHNALLHDRFQLELTQTKVTVVDILKWKVAVTTPILSYEMWNKDSNIGQYRLQQKLYMLKIG